MELAIQHSRQCDLSLVLGTSLFVQPAASLPDKVLKNPNGKLVVVNLQRTPMDKQCSIRIFSKTDKFMELLLDNLGVKNINVEYDHIQQMKNKKKNQFCIVDCWFCCCCWCFYFSLPEKILKKNSLTQNLI